MSIAAAGAWAQVLLVAFVGAIALYRGVQWLLARRRPGNGKPICPVNAAPQLEELVHLNRDTLLELRQLVSVTREAQVDHREMLVHLRNS